LERKIHQGELKMATEIILPDLNVDVDEVLINTWHFKEGDRVNEGDDLVELQVGTTIFNLPTPVSGILLEILVDEGDAVEFGEALATVDEE